MSKPAVIVQYSFIQSPTWNPLISSFHPVQENHFFLLDQSPVYTVQYHLRAPSASLDAH